MTPTLAVSLLRTTTCEMALATFRQWQGTRNSTRRNGGSGISALSARVMMGAHFYWYVVGYQADVDAALQELREREFKAGRYSPVIRVPDFPVGPDSSAPGPRHRTIREAIRAAGEDGTRSILDIERITTDPDYSAAAPLPDQLLIELYGTVTPTREMVEPDLAFSEYMDERGQGIYIVLHREGQPHEILFAGYSFD